MALTHYMHSGYVQTKDKRDKCKVINKCQVCLLITYVAERERSLFHLTPAERASWKRGIAGTKAQKYDNTQHG